MADKPRKRVPDSVVFYSYPKLLFAWPIILLGFVLYPIAGAPWQEEPVPLEQSQVGDTVNVETVQATRLVVEKNTYREVLAWIYIITIVIVILTLGVDIERNYAVFWLVVVLALFFGGSWLASKMGWPIFGAVYDFFSDMDIQYNRYIGLALSLFLVVPYIVMVFWARLNDKWRITHNEFEHYALGRADDSLARGAKRVRSTYPDLFELLLGMSGTLIVYSATGRSELRRIPHVPLLPLRRKQIDQILEYTAVKTSNDVIIEEEMEEDIDDEAVADNGGGEVGHERL